MDRLQSHRWNGFRRRVNYAPHTVYRHEKTCSEYIPIHPFADEPDELARLGLHPEDCIGVDAWWGIDGDATLVQAWAVSAVGHPVGLYAQMTPHDEAWCYLSAVIDAHFVTRVAFEAAMSRFVELGFPTSTLFHLTTGSGLTLLSHH